MKIFKIEFSANLTLAWDNTYICLKWLCRRPLFDQVSLSSHKSLSSSYLKKNFPKKWDWFGIPIKIILTRNAVLRNLDPWNYGKNKKLLSFPAWLQENWSKIEVSSSSSYVFFIEFIKFKFEIQINQKFLNLGEFVVLILIFFSFCYISYILTFWRRNIQVLIRPRIVLEGWDHSRTTKRSNNLLDFL